MAARSEVEAIFKLRDQMSAVLKTIQASLGKVDDNTKKAHASLQNISQRVSFKGLAASIIGAQAAMMAMRAAVRAVRDAFMDSLRASSEFGDAMTRSTAIMGELSDAMRTDMAEAAQEVSETATFSAKQAAEAYYYLASAGLDAAQSLGALPQVAKFAQAGTFDLSRATDLLTDAQSALGLTMKDSAGNMENMARVSDVLVKANTLANASVEQFSEALTTKAGAALKILGKDVEEGVAVLAAFADQGVKASDAGTALNIVLRDLSTKAINNADAFKKAGVAVFDASGDMRNIADIIGDLEGALAGLSDAQAKATLLQLGFADKSVIFIQTLLGMSERIREYETELRKAGGTTQEVADKQLESFASKSKLVQQGWENMLRAIGDFITESRGLRELMDALAGAMNNLSGSLGTNRAQFVALVSGGIVFVLDSLQSFLQVAGLTIKGLGELGRMIVSVQKFFLDLYDVILNNPISKVLIPNFTLLGKDLRSFVDQARDVVLINEVMADAMAEGGEEALALSGQIGVLVNNINLATTEQILNLQATENQTESFEELDRTVRTVSHSVGDLVPDLMSVSRTLDLDEAMTREFDAALASITPRLEMDFTRALDLSEASARAFAAMGREVGVVWTETGETATQSGNNIGDAIGSMSRQIGGSLGQAVGSVQTFMSAIQSAEEITTASTAMMVTGWIGVGVAIAGLVQNLHGLLPPLSEIAQQAIEIYNAAQAASSTASSSATTATSAQGGMFERLRKPTMILAHPGELVNIIPAAEAAQMAVRTAQGGIPGKLPAGALPPEYVPLPPEILNPPMVPKPYAGGAPPPGGPASVATFAAQVAAAMPPSVAVSAPANINVNLPELSAKRWLNTIDDEVIPAVRNAIRNNRHGLMSAIREQL